jgi:hypothetical protein
MWETLRTTLVNKNLWKDTMRLRNSSRQLWIVEEDEPFWLFKVEVQGKNEFTISVNASTRDYYKLTLEDVETCLATGRTATSQVRE